MSHLVAVAGGSAHLGRTIVEAIVADGRFEVLILGRKANAELEKEIGAPIVPVDYTSIDALVKVLEERKIDTVISTLSVTPAADAELNLIAAADKATSTKRFVASIWGMKSPEKIAATFPAAQIKLDVAAAVARTSLDHTVWYPGYFTDYFVAPNVQSHMFIYSTVFDMASNMAVIPGTGDVPVVLTHTYDIAKFVAASLALPKWEPETYLIGDKVTWNELLAIAEAVKGVKFQVTYESIEKLESDRTAELPNQAILYASQPKKQLQGFLSKFNLMFAQGVFDLNPDRTINQAFPDIKTRSVKELMEEAWSGEAV